MDTKSKATVNGSGKQGKMATDAPLPFDTSFKGFVNHDLTEREKREYEIWATEVQVSDALAAALRDLKKLTVKYSEKENCFQAFLFDLNAASKSAGWILSARAADPVKAQYRVLFLNELLGENWIKGTRPAYSEDRW